MSDTANITPTATISLRNQRYFNEKKRKRKRKMRRINKTA
jgi:hypothetical protein